MRILKRPRQCGTDRPCVQGLTLLETVVALAILTVGLLALATTTQAAQQRHSTDHARQLASDALASAVREVEVAAKLLARSEGNWSSALLTQFAGEKAWRSVPGLKAWKDQPGVIELRFFADETIGDRELECSLGMPRDLDSDGFASRSDVSQSARLLPVVARARWESDGGERELCQGFYVSGY